MYFARDTDMIPRRLPYDIQLFPQKSRGSCKVKVDVISGKVWSRPDLKCLN